MLHAHQRFRYTPDTVFDMFPWPQFEVAQASAPAGSGGVPPDSQTVHAKTGRDARSTRRQDGYATNNPRRGRGRAGIAAIAPRNHAG
jgi:hypothetical protein